MSETGAPSARSLLTSFALHALVLAVPLLVPAEVLSRSIVRQKPKQLDIVFHRPAPVPAPAVPPPLPKQGAAAPRKGVEGPVPKVIPPKPKEAAPGDPGDPGLPPGPEKGAPAAEAPPEPKVGKAGILAFRDKFASLAQDKPAP